jgi:cytochrome c oxidase subunit IV
MARAVALLALVALGNVTQTGPVHRQHRIEIGFYEPILFVLSQLKWLIAYFAIDFFDSEALAIKHCQ